jgi:hypothetical protein
MATTTITASCSVRVRGAEGSPAMATAVARTLGEALGAAMQATASAPSGAAAAESRK